MNVPPDFLGVVDAISLDQQLDEILPPQLEDGDIRAREFVEYLAAIRFQRCPCPARTELVESARMCGRK
jgi:hypothetical protein